VSLSGRKCTCASAAKSAALRSSMHVRYSAKQNVDRMTARETRMLLIGSTQFRVAERASTASE